MVACQWAGISKLHHFSSESFSELMTLGLRPRRAPQIVQFLWVAGEIIKLAPIGPFIKRQSMVLCNQAARAEIICEAHVAAALMLFNEDCVVACFSAIDRFQ